MQEWNSRTLQMGAVTIVLHQPVLSSGERALRERRAKEILGRTMTGLAKRKEPK